ncbi:MAG: hypothetical protein AAEC03_00930 [Synechococcus sp.]
MVHGRRRHDNSAVRSLRITLEADALQCIGRNCFGGTAGDVRFDYDMPNLAPSYHNSKSDPLNPSSCPCCRDGLSG